MITLARATITIALLLALMLIGTIIGARSALAQEEVAGQIRRCGGFRVDTALLKQSPRSEFQVIKLLRNQENWNKTVTIKVARTTWHKIKGSEDIDLDFKVWVNGKPCALIREQL
jgi:hypothetical protein